MWLNKIKAQAIADNAACEAATPPRNPTVTLETAVKQAEDLVDKADQQPTAAAGQPPLVVSHHLIIITAAYGTKTASTQHLASVRQPQTESLIHAPSMCMHVTTGACCSNPAICRSCTDHIIEMLHAIAPLYQVSQV
jgi:hypothetical protein